MGAAARGVPPAGDAESSMRARSTPGRGYGSPPVTVWRIVPLLPTAQPR